MEKRISTIKTNLALINTIPEHTVILTKVTITESILKYQAKDMRDNL